MRVVLERLDRENVIEKTEVYRCENLVSPNIARRNNRACSSKKETKMLYAMSWFVVVVLLAVWSLGAWAFHSVAAWAIASAGVPASGLPKGTLQWPDWLAPWVPPELDQALTSMLSAFGPAIDSAIGWIPALAGGLSIALGVVWAAGCALLILLGLVLSGTIALLRRPAPARASAVA